MTLEELREKNVAIVDEALTDTGLDDLEALLACLDLICYSFSACVFEDAEEVEHEEIDKRLVAISQAIAVYLQQYAANGVEEIAILSGVLSEIFAFALAKKQESEKE